MFNGFGKHDGGCGCGRGLNFGFGDDCCSLIILLLLVFALGIYFGYWINKMVVVCKVFWQHF